MDIEEQLELMDKYSFRAIGPVMYEYTLWVLTEAQKRGFKRLYFLARDGYLLCEIAKKICSKQSFDIECRYLYCSRYSLRMPSYHLIGEEAFDLLLLNGYYITPKTLLMRAEFDPSEQNEIYRQLKITDENKVLSDYEFGKLADKLKENKFYINSVIEKSKTAYKPAIDYFRQEDLFENDYIAIVDSGWTGSMQRSLRILMESAGYKGKFCGFYFGMYAKPKESIDGEYLNFYFDWEAGIMHKIMFNNNLFECMLSAPHGMTLRYDYSDWISTPVLAEYQKNEMHWLVEHQIQGALKYSEEHTDKKDFTYDYKKSLRICYKILKRTMVFPTADEVKMYSRFMFCDDVTEGYHLTLTEKNMKQALNDNMLVPRVFRKLFRIKKHTAVSKPLWIYGLTAEYPAPLRLWYRLNILAWDILKFLLKR